MSRLKETLKKLGLAPRKRLHVAGDVGEGPVVVLVHGIASSSVTFQNLVPLLEGRHRVISIDLLGHGGSPSPRRLNYTVEQHVDWLYRTIRSLRIRGDYTIVGHSLGALIVSRYARFHPARLNQVVLVSPPVYLPASSLGDPLERMATSAYMKAYDYLRTNKKFTIRQALVVAHLLPIKNVLEVTEKNWDAFRKSLQNCIESQTTLSDIAGIRAPVDIVYGALDQFIVPGGFTVLSKLRNVTMHRVELNDHIVRKRLARAVDEAIV